MWPQEDTLHHINYLELLATFLALQSFAKHKHSMTIQMKLDNVTAVTYINKLGGHILPSVESTGLDNMGVVSTEEFIPSSRTFSGKGKCSSRSGVKADERSLRLDAKSPSIQTNTADDGASTYRSVCFMTNEKASNVLQLEARSRGPGNECVQLRLASEEGICQPAMVLDCTLSEPDKEAGSQSSDDHSSMGIPILVSSHPGNAGGFSQDPPSSGRSGDTSNRGDFIMSHASGMANLQRSYYSRSCKTSPCILEI